jgi:hypothetical protein
MGSRSAPGILDIAARRSGLARSAKGLMSAHGKT